MFIKIGGVQGAGKTSLTHSLVFDFKKLGYTVEAVKGSDLMSAKLGVSPNDLPFQPEEERKAARVAVYKELYAKDREKPGIRVRDGHFALVNRDESGGFIINVVDLLPEDTQQLRGLVLLDPPLHVVAARRHENAFAHGEMLSADRNRVDVGLLQKEIEVEREVAHQQAQELGLPLHIIDSGLESLQEVTTLIVRSLKKDIRLWKEIERHREFGMRRERYA